MQPKDLNLAQWQELLEKFKATNPKGGSPIAMRIENTQLTTARYYGGCTFNDTGYTYFEPLIPDALAIPDGTPCVAWLLVRDDFLKWVKKAIRKAGIAKKDFWSVTHP